MSARALLYYFSPKPKVPPDISVHMKSFGSDIRIRVGHSERSCVLFGVVSGKRAVRKVLAQVKSKRYEVSKSEKFKEALNDVVVAKNSPTVSGQAWREEFPKRWVIVVLCFSAFLLCNMNRVNMSIAILPMSAEFNWNPATVGLIHSSFFWGYLLTQIAGGIWADTVGGKKVLGFAVIWWSTATVLTHVAAKLGLPFLLVVRAFMGIGEKALSLTPMRVSGPRRVQIPNRY